MQQNKNILIWIIDICILLVVGYLLMNLNIIGILKNTSADISIQSSFVFFMAGLIDGINPCALSMLLFFIMLLINSDKQKINILVVGFLFALGTFIAYFLSGFGLIKIFEYVKVLKYLPEILYFSSGIICIVLAIWNFKDAFYAKKQMLNKVTLQLPKENKKFIHNLIKKLSLKKYQYLSAFLLGFLVTLSELLCTGQIYVFTAMILQKASSWLKNLYLLIYNIGFIVPILVITAIIHKTKNNEVFSRLLFEKLWIIKFITGIVMAILGVVILKQI